MRIFTLPVGCHPIAANGLVRVLSQALTYLYVGGVRVDIMIASRTWSQATPAFADDGDEGVSVCGVIRPGKGESYLMPRAVSLEVGAHEPTATLFYPAWFLQGLERLAGTRVELRNLRQSGPDCYWYGARHSCLRLEEERT